MFSIKDFLSLNWLIRSPLKNVNFSLKKKNCFPIEIHTTYQHCFSTLGSCTGSGPIIFPAPPRIFRQSYDFYKSLHGYTYSKILKLIQVEENRNYGVTAKNMVLQKYVKY